MNTIKLVNHFPLLIFFLFFIFTTTIASSSSEKETYIVHLRSPPPDIGLLNIDDWHRSFLPQDEPRLICSYTEVFSGFAAKLTEEEVSIIQQKDALIRVYRDRLLPLATTHSPEFLGLRVGNGFWNVSGLGKGVIIGVLDTGLLPTHPSFGDDGVPPPPRRWKGVCYFGGAGCNNKIIGARAIGSAAANATAPPVDDAGHGTHTASTAAGNFVADASVRGNANGTAAGIAPHAHLAIYKVCSRSRCSMVDILAGLDAAVKDGVDVVSLSLGGGSAPFEYDPIAIAAFKAMEKGIFVSCAAGNEGPAPSSVSNAAPWVLTVAAGTMDRAIRAKVRLGDGREFDGESLFQSPNSTSTRLPLIYPATNNTPADCSFLDNFDIEGKIVLCQSPGLTGRIDAGIGVLAFGGAGMILMNPKPDGYTTFADAHVLPASHVSYAAGSEIISYVNSTSAPTATIAFEGTVLGSSPAPTVAFFSSRGPGKASPGIIKPDVTGPGMNILAAWAAPAETRSTMAVSTERAFNMVSGTSMSTPHLSGVAALIKSVHPHWSPAAIKSAIMTTSDFVDHSGEPIKNEQYQKASFFAMGAGYVNPSRAVDPGLVYDLGVNDYIAYLCGLGLGDAGVSAVAHRNIRCSTIRNVTEAELNYPSILVNPQDKPITVKRTVTNVGKASSTYVAAVEVPEEVVVVRVRPRILHFSKANEKKSFAVTVQRKGGSKNGVEGNLKWVSGEHVVRSPILIPAKSSASFASAFAVNS
ncbi:Subtilisin-like protease SBT1.2 [Ananas comosus]|uniref:Subtilisin-like protease SBT1.2 n=1 Tax=Ananas comosus TaxID=4615 RepID=A0A199VBU9_ANACO|nr:Subtilisin-like protease SBT1.2 [Ananas comosus]